MSYTNKFSTVQSVQGHTIVYLGHLRVANLKPTGNGEEVAVETLDGYNDTTAYNVKAALGKLEMIVLGAAV